MGVLKSVVIDEITARGSIRDIDVIKLRSVFYDDVAISAEEAALLISINRQAEVQDPAWGAFFVEALTDYIVNQAKPEGYVTAENAKWLIEMIGPGGRVETKLELDLLVHVIEEARWSPASLVRFALDQVKQAVATGNGPLREGTAVAAGEISETEIELIRRIVYAFGGDGNVAVTRAEAEVMFDINDLVGAGRPNPAWTDLFVKAIANSLMAASGYAVPSREEALRREEWLESDELSPATTASLMTKLGLSAIWHLFRDQSSEERALARLEQQRIEIITNEAITEGEAEWLANRLGRDGKLTENEAALLDFIGRESQVIHPLLAKLVASKSVAVA